jgi:hypothetical protein
MLNHPRVARSRVWKAVQVVTALSLIGCAQQTAAPRLPVPSDNKLSVVIENKNTQDVKLYVVNGSSRIRVGSAPSMRTTELQLPALFAKSVGGLELEAQPLGGGAAVRFTAIFAGANDRIVLAVAPSITMSTFAVYSRS